MAHQRNCTVRLTRKKKLAWKTYTQHFSAENRIKYEDVSKELIKKVRNAKQNQERKLKRLLAGRMRASRQCK